jgi:manganese oxidase
MNRDRAVLAGASVGLVVAAVVAGCGQEQSGVEAEPARPAAGTRVYFVAADEVEWDYAPSGMNLITGAPFGPQENIFVESGPGRIGRKYHKLLYREYTDETFANLKPRPPEWEHLGTLGPVLRAVVGDTIEVAFRNNTDHPLSMHPHGVFYRKDSEGAPYADGTDPASQADDAVPPGGTYRYVWEVPERAGPGPMDGSSVMWMYHSHVDEVRDTNAGLIGPILVTAADRARDDGTPDDVDRELVTMFTVFDENASLLLEENVATYAGDPASVDPEDEEFEESNLMHSINGFVYGNLPGLTMRQGERVRWYLMGMGTEVDLHTPHWHGQTATVMGMRTDVAELLPASMAIADMVPDDPGTWLYHCHVNDHIAAGMAALFTVEP